MQVLDRAGVGTLWSICKTKFALAGHTHSSVTDGTMTIYPMANNEVNFGGSNNSATIYFGYRAKDSKPIPTSFVFGGSTGTATLTAAKFKGALEGNASTASNASRVNGHTVNSDVPSGAKFTDTNTWRGIQDNLTSTSTSESLSANQGKVLKGLIDGKANSNHTHSWSQISGAPATATRWPSWGEVTSKPDLKSWSETKSYIDNKLSATGGGMIYKSNYGMSVVNDSDYPMDVYESGIDGEIVGEIDKLRTKAKISRNNKTYDCFYNFWLKYIYSESLDYLFQKLKINKDVLKTVLNITPSETNSSFGIILLRLNDNVIIEQSEQIFANPNNQYNRYIIAYKKLTDNGLVDCDSKGNILN